MFRAKFHQIRELFPHDIVQVGGRDDRAGGLALTGSGCHGPSHRGKKRAPIPAIQEMAAHTTNAISKLRSNLSIGIGPEDGGVYCTPAE